MISDEQLVRNAILAWLHEYGNTGNPQWIEQYRQLLKKENIIAQPAPPLKAAAKRRTTRTRKKTLPKPNAL